MTKSDSWAPALLVFLLSFVIQASWALASPPGSAPDEDTHLSSAWCIADSGSSPCAEINVRLVDIGKCFYRDSGINASCDHYETIEKSKPERSVGTTFYYQTLSKFISNDIDMSVLFMRFNNALIMSFILFMLSLKLKKETLVATIISWLVVNLPLGFFLIPSVSTSSWLLISTFTIFPLIYEFSKIDSQNIGLRITFLILLYHFAVTARWDTKLFFTIIILISSYNFYDYLQNAKIRIVLKSVFLAANIILLYIIWGFSEIALAQVKGYSLWEHVYRIYSIPIGVFGGWGLGSLEVDLPATVSVVSLIIIFMLLYLGLDTQIFKNNIMSLTLCTYIILVPLFIIIKSNLRVGEWVQPRYILPLFYPLIFIAVKNIIMKNASTNRNLLTFIALSSTVSFSISLHTLLRRYTIGLESYVFNLNQDPIWWWNLNLIPGPMFIFSLGTISYIFLWILISKIFFQTMISTQKINQ